MATFYNAKRYGARNAIYAPNVIKDCLENKGNPTLTEYVLPLTINALGYCVVGNFNSSVIVSDYNDVSVQIPPLGGVSKATLTEDRFNSIEFYRK